MNLKKFIFLFIFPLFIFSQGNEYENGKWNIKQHTPQTQQKNTKTEKEIPQTQQKEKSKKKKNEVVRKSVSEIIDGKKWFGELILFDDSTSTWTPWSKKEIEKSRALLNIKSDTMKIFNEYWSTSKLFPYSKAKKNKNLQNFKDTIWIDLEASGDFYCSPSNKVNSPFGWRYRRQHHGVDTYGKTGDTLRAAFDGKVRFSGWNDGGYGHLIIIRHFNGLETYYAHCSKRISEAGDVVKAGDVIALLGETGRADGPHLHFEMRYFDQAFDPQNVIDIENQQIKDKFKSKNKNGEDTYKYPLTKRDFSYIRKNNAKKYHKVKSGETGSQLGYKYYRDAYTGWKKIKKLNKLKSDIIYPGQKLRVK